MSNDPFEGISDKDISKYSDLFDVPPPENDDEALRLSQKIKAWISNGRPHPKDLTKQTDDEEKSQIRDEPKQDKQEEKPKKKRGMFGFFRK